MKVLIMGLPGSGKTVLAEKLQLHLNCALFNDYRVRKMSNDFDFSIGGHIRQSFRMRNIANFEKEHGNSIIICDYVCPTQWCRRIFEADFSIWLNTISLERGEDIDSIFEIPSYADIVIEKFLTDKEIISVVNKIAGVYE
jgi:cytidylate kinase